MKKILLTAPLYVLISVAQADPISDSFKQVGDGFKQAGNETAKAFQPLTNLFKKKPYKLPDLDNGADPDKVCNAASQGKANKSCENMNDDDAIPLIFLCPTSTAKGWRNSKCKQILESRFADILNDMTNKPIQATSPHTQAILNSEGTKDAVCNGWYNSTDTGFRARYKTLHHSWCKLYTKAEMEVIYGQIYEGMKFMFGGLPKDQFVESQVADALRKQD